MQAMSRASLAAAVVLVAAVAARATLLHADAPLAPLPGPASQDLPDGPGKDLVVRLCSGCHDLVFTVSTRETEAGWTAIVNDMRSPSF